MPFSHARDLLPAHAISAVLLLTYGNYLGEPGAAAAQSEATAHGGK